MSHKTSDEASPRLSAAGYADSAELLLFDEAMPLEDLSSSAGFISECVPDKKHKIEDLFRFRRGQGDYRVSLVVMFLALFFLVFFFTQTGWQDRKLPDDLSAYLGHQFGFVELEGRVTRFGRILRQSWVAPLLCLALLVPTAIWNFRDSRRVHLWRQRFQLPTDSHYEFLKYLAALEFVGYFIVYTLAVPWLGYLLSTLILGTFLTFRLGYRSLRWIVRSLLTGMAIVLVFRTLLNIKTPANIWLYDQLPVSLRAFMLTHF